MKNYADLAGVLTDKELASLGDAFINFVYSLALSERKHQPSGAKVRGRTLAEAFRKSGLRGYMPSRVTRHMLADAAEALAVYGWLCHHVTLKECVAILARHKDLVEGMGRLLLTVKENIRF
ncbi:hypothetical protein GTO27_11175 [Candidatus Bathyarchaeota archaeon]|nr:hypothetical protein [Candidatus Bathyarchaeota archaeon]